MGLIGEKWLVFLCSLLIAFYSLKQYNRSNEKKIFENVLDAG
jgi:hypothetical protein